MSPLDTLSAFLDPDYNPNYWSDDAVLHANALVLKFTSEDWDSLPALIPTKPHPWQARLADALDAAPADRAVPILLRLLLSPSSDVARQAANTLYSFHSQGHPIPLSPETTDRLKSIAAESRLHGILIEAILRSGPAIFPKPGA